MKNAMKTMLHVDFRRMFTQPLLYILVCACFLMPILILVMTTMMAGSVTVDPTTGVETVIEGFDSVWQILGAESGAAGAMSMDMTAMCNINMLYFLMAVPVCVFTADDFRVGFSKNLFTVRAKRGEYVASKTVVCVAGGVLMLLAFFWGALLGGEIAGLSFALGSGGVAGLVLSMLAKLVLTAVFVPIYLLWSVCAKQRLWLSLVGSLMCGMFLFMMIPMLTPLDATMMHVLLCLAGGVLFSVGLGAVSKTVLKKRDIV